MVDGLDRTTVDQEGRDVSSWNAINLGRTTVDWEGRDLSFDSDRLACHRRQRDLWVLCHISYH